MKTLTTLLSPLYLLTWLFTLSLLTPTHAADLTFTPATPVVQINQTITLSVAGAVGQVRWQAFDGKIQGEGNQVTYLAPETVGKDTVTVVDSEDNTGVLKVVITPPNDFSLENAQWEVFTNRSQINALSLSEDGKTLWVGTKGGLEKRDAQTGEIQQVFINTDGLPDNVVTAIASDSQGGLWVGTDTGLAHYAQGQWQVFNQDNSDLPDNIVTALFPDSQGGLWVGTLGGLAHYAQGQWQVFNQDNSGLPFNGVSALLSDSQGGLWVGTNLSGLAHYAQGQWQVFNANNSGLPSNGVSALLPDSQGGLWVGTSYELAHYAQGQWQVFNKDNSGLPDNNVNALLTDSQGGLWVGTLGGLAHYVQGQWQMFNTNNSGLPSNEVHAFQPDSQGGVWVGTVNGLAHYAQGKWRIFNDSGLPSNNVQALLPDSQGGLWVGTVNGLARYAQGQWQVFNRDNSGLPNNDIQALLLDSQGGLWVGIGCQRNNDSSECVGGGLAHYAQGQWQVFNRDNSGLPSNDVRALLLDSQGGLWVGTTSAGWDSEKRESIGLAYWNAQGQWQVFNTDNSGLYYDIKSLLHDSQDGLWVVSYWGQFAHYAQGQWQVFNTEIPGRSSNDAGVILPDSQDGMWVGSGFGLAHYVQGQGQVFNTDNSGLPDDNVNALLLDGQGGLWVGMHWGGLAHYAQGQWQVFNADNSGLPNNWVTVISGDNQGGLWVGTYDGGLAHLTFGRQTGTTSTDIPQVTPVTTVINTVSDCTGSNTVGDLCNAGGKTITVTDIKPSGTLANGILNSAVTSQGWVSNVTLTATGKLSGGVVTGYIKNEGIMLDFEFKGLSIIGGTLGGVIINTSQVGGYFQDVTLQANTKITGGVLKGTIKGDKQSPALLEKVTVKAGSHLSGVKLGTGVKLEQGVVVEPLEETLTTTLPNLGPAIATDAKGQPVPTQTEMMGGISLDGKTFKPTGEAKQLSETVAIVGRLQPDPAHVKQKVSLFVTVTYQPTQDSQEKYFFKLNAQGGLIPWTEGDLASLGQDLFQSEVMLPATFDVTIYHGVLLATGIVKVNFGYLLPDGTAVQSQQPIELTVTK